MDPNTERTFILVKPDGVRRGLIGEVISRIERRGYVIDRLQVVSATPELLRVHYVEHADKPFFPRIEAYMMSGPMVAIVASGAGVVQAFRAIAGATNPMNAVPGTLRGDFGRDWGTDDVFNIVHGSDSPQNAEREISLWLEG